MLADGEQYVSAVRYVKGLRAGSSLVRSTRGSRH
jgi:hypothetical protein